MLTKTFVHIPGIGLKSERRFWSSGILDWDDFAEPFPISLSSSKIESINRHVELSKRYLVNNPNFFAGSLPPSQHWRIFPHFRHSTAYLDIETTGLDGYQSQITTLSLYDGDSISYYVHGENLDDFIEDITNYQVLITYNGKCFDIPFIENFFGIKIKQAHIDLRYVLKNLGYSGGLKGCEKQLGIERGELNGVDGYFAVLLWREFQQTGDRKALETLLAYNIQDVINLEILMVAAYNKNISTTPFSRSHILPCPSTPTQPFTADLKIIDKIRKTYWR